MLKVHVLAFSLYFCGCAEDDVDVVDDEAAPDDDDVDGSAQ